jgi:hypothetical protein
VKPASVSAGISHARRSAYSSSIACSASCGPVSAASAAYWLTVQVLIDSVWRGSVTFSTKSSGAAR